MKKLYQKTFEQALAQTYAPPEQVEAQRSALASRCSKPELEVTAMTTKLRRPIRILITAAVVAAALTAGALAASGVLSRIPLLTGGAMERGVNPDGTGYSSVSVSTDQESYPVEARDGKIWFTTETGEELDITGQFSETEPYVYSYTDADGINHDLVVGGTAEDLKPCFNEDGLGAIVNSSRGIIAAYRQEKYAKFGPEHFGEASRQAVLDMAADISRVL